MRAIVAAGGDAIGRGLFYDDETLRAYMRKQRDSVWCIDSGGRRKGSVDGYAVLLSLRPRTVEWIRSGDLVRGRDILDTDLEGSLEESDAMYVGMVHGEPRVAPTLVRHFVQLALDFDRRRRPQLVLARPGTSMGRLVMNRMGFGPFGEAPEIEATYTDRLAFIEEARRRGAC